MVTTKTLIGGMAIASIVGAGLGMGASIAVVPHLVSAGPRGAQGATGAQGLIGSPGTDGLPGLSGPPGAPGRDATGYQVNCLTDTGGFGGSTVVTSIYTDLYAPYQTHILTGNLRTTCTVSP